jgi:hypothetical protein
LMQLFESKFTHSFLSLTVSILYTISPIALK